MILLLFCQYHQKKPMESLIKTRRATMRTRRRRTTRRIQQREDVVTTTIASTKKVIQSNHSSSTIRGILVRLRLQLLPLLLLLCNCKTDVVVFVVGESESKFPSTTAIIPLEGRLSSTNTGGGRQRRLEDESNNNNNNNGSLGDDDDDDDDNNNNNNNNNDDDDNNTFASCADGQKDHICYHGGVCVPIVENDQYHCDCTHARSDDGNNIPYVGKWCHLPPQVYCRSGSNSSNDSGDDSDNNDNGGDHQETAASSTHFCVNDGTCQEDNTCNCWDDFVGVHCEFHKGDVTVTEDDLLGGTDGDGTGPDGGDDDTAGQTSDTGNDGNTAQQQEGGQDCPLQCQNGGTCYQNDVKDGSSTSSSHTCICLDGYKGDLCENIDLGTPCGHTGQSCLHGSTCVKTLSGQYACDCTTVTTTTTTTTDSPMGGGFDNTTEPSRKFTGRWCQYEASVYCDEDRKYFCANDGRCVGTDASSPENDGNVVYSCQCDETKWTGPSCEFEVNGDTERDYGYENCTLSCLNGGVCRKGATEDTTSSLVVVNNGDDDNDNGSGPSSPSAGSVFNENFEHCACPDGYAGLACQHRYDVCGNREHFCLHGSKCVRVDNNTVDDGSTVRPPSWTCQCEEAFRPDGRYTGPFCQHHHSMLCTTEDTDKSVYDPSTSVAFCLNDGVCAEIVESGQGHPGCSCPPGYTGAHCELLDTIQDVMMIHSNDGDHGGGGGGGTTATILVCSVLGTTLVTIFVVYCLRRRAFRSRSRRGGRDGIIRSSQLEHGNGQLNQKQSAIMMEEIDFDPDFDERDLEEVELL